MKSLFLLLVIALISSTSASFKYSASKTITLKTINAVGQTITIQEKVGVQNGAAFNQIIIKSGSSTATFGYSGITSQVSKSISQSQPIMKFAFPSMPAISLSLKGTSSLSYSIKEQGGKLIMTLSGSIAAGCEIKSGFDTVASLSCGATGTIVHINSNVGITSSNSLTQSIKASGGDVTINIKGKTLGVQVFDKSVKLWSGWSKSA